MKKILILVLTLFISSVANADVIGQSLSKASEKISEYTIGLIPGEGHTEVSIDLRESSKPDYSILAVRELLKIDSGNIFTQRKSRIVNGVTAEPNTWNWPEFKF